MSNEPTDEESVTMEGEHTQTTVEACKTCGEASEHRISIELVTESEDADNEEYSREPYRITECLDCGTTSQQRLNDR